MIKRDVKENAVLLAEAGKLIAQGHTVTMLAKGRSMSPFIVHLRDKVILGAFDPDSLKKGDCVLAKVQSGQYVLHRIIRRDGDRLILKGDGNVSGCEMCTVDDVQGILLRVIRNGREVSTSSFAWRACSKVWIFLDPLRRWLLAIWRRLC